MMGSQRQPCDLPSPQSTASFWHSEPSPLLIGHRSTRELPRHADVVIVGSGMTGCSIAHHLLTTKRGGRLDVVMLEAREACWGATGRNGGHCQPNFISFPEDPSIGHFELANYLSIADLIKTKTIDCEFNQQSVVHAFYSQPIVARASAALNLVSKNAPHLASFMRLVTDSRELHALRVPLACGAIVSSVAARMWPYKFVARVLVDLLTAPDLAGSFNLQTLTPALTITTISDGVLVVTQRGTIKAKQVALATNGYTSHLLPEFTDFILPCRGQMSALDAPLSLSGGSRLHSSYSFSDDSGMDDYLIQRANTDGAQLMFGGGRRFGRSLDVTDDNAVDTSTAEYLRSQLLKSLGPLRPDPSDADHLCSGNELEASYMWTGVMGFSRDSRPWVGVVPGRKHVYLAAGFSGHGMPNTWLCGGAIATMIRQSSEGTDEQLATKVAQEITALPASYIITTDRLANAHLLPEPTNADSLTTE